MRVVVAGGTGTIGSSIVSALASSDKHTPIILSRKTSNETNTSVSSTGIEIRHVDYTSPDSLVPALHDIDAVMSALLIPSPDLITCETNLLHAAEEAGCKRFAPSSYALHSSCYADVTYDRAKLEVWHRVQESVAQGKIDAAMFPCGMLMNYLDIGCPREKEALAGFKKAPPLFYLAGPNTRINIPVRDGEEHLPDHPSVTLTDLRDVGKYAVAALELEEPWGGRELGIEGQTIDVGDIADLYGRFIGPKIEERRVTVSQFQGMLDVLEGSGDHAAYAGAQYAIVCGRWKAVVDPVFE